MRKVACGAFAVLSVAAGYGLATAFIGGAISSSGGSPAEASIVETPASTVGVPDSGFKPGEGRFGQLIRSAKEELEGLKLPISGKQLESISAKGIENAWDTNVVSLGVGYSFGIAFPGAVPSLDPGSWRALRYNLPGLLLSHETRSEPGYYLGVVRQAASGANPNEKVRNRLLVWSVLSACRGGELNPNDCVSVLKDAFGAGMITDDGVETLGDVLSLAGQLSPHTFEQVFAQLTSTFPEAALSFSGRLSIDSKGLSVAINSLGKEKRDAIVNRLTQGAINGTFSEVKQLLNVFPDPSLLPARATANMVVALCFYGGGDLEDWLQKLSAPAKKNALSELSKILDESKHAEPGSKISEIDFRSVQLLRSKEVLGSLEGPLFERLINNISGKDAVGLLDDLLARGSSFPLLEQQEFRVKALNRSMLNRAQAYGFSSIESAISPVPGSQDTATTDAALSAMLALNRPRLEEMLQETKDEATKSRINAALVSAPDYRKSYGDQLQVLTQELKSSGQAPAPSLEAAVDRFMADENRWDRSTDLRLLDAIPSGAIKDSAYRSLSKKWAALDPVGLSEWLADQAPSAFRDIGAAELVMNTAGDPEIALANASAISDQALRRSAAESVVNRWKGINPNFARRFIAGSKLTDSEKSDLFSALDDRK